VLHIGPHVWRVARRGRGASVCPLDRNLDERDAIDRLWIAVLENLEIFFAQLTDDLALRIGDDSIDFDERDVAAVCDLRPIGRSGRRRL
jgi:hypothetical protein